MSIASEINRISQNISDSFEVIAAKGVTVPSGSNSDDLPELIAAIPIGSGNAFTIVDTIDANGGLIRTITGVSLVDDTVTAAHLEYGYTAHDAEGTAIIGTLVPGITPTGTINITASGTHDVTNYASASVAAGSATGPTSLSGSSATLTTGTNTITLTKTGISTTPTVSAGYISSASSSTATVALTAAVTTKAAATITPSTSNQTIASGTYLTGAQTISGDANLIAGNIKSGVSIFGVTGNYAGPGVTLQTKTGITPTESSQTITYDSGYDGLNSVQINAISSTYVGSGITSRSSSDLTASGATVSVPAGYYANNASKTISSGTEGTPTATKGTVSNHSVTVTPSVTNVAGYISGGTHSGTAVTINVNELESGTKSITANGTGISVSGYSAVDVAVEPDCPIFTINIDDNSGDILSITCNKTYTECLEYFDDDDDELTNGALIDNKFYDDNTLVYEMTSGASSRPPISDTANIVYTVPDSYDGMVPQVAITYSSSGTITWSQNPVTRRDSTDLTASGATVTAPAGYYSSDATKTIASGTEGTPTATKGTVSNHSISITPSVTNSAGYISGGTHNGTAVSVSASELVSGTKSISSNGTNIDVTNYAAVDVTVSPSLQAKTNISPTESTQTIEADNGYDGLSSVQINAISSTYVGSGITSRSSSDLTASGATVSVPAGYYASAASKAVSAMTLPTAAAASATSGYTSKATISRSTSDQYINIPTGYNSAGAYYKISAVTNGSVTAPASISGTSATLSTGTGTLTLTKTVSVTPNVTSAGYISSGTAGNSEVSLTASVTIDPTPTASGATVTIPAGYYSAQATKSVTTMTLPTSASSSATSGYTSKATISRSTSDQYINIAPGYNSAGGYYKISAVANGSATAPASISGTSATVSTGTNTLTLTKTVSVTPSVTEGYISSGTAGNSSVSLTANVNIRSSSDLTVSGATVTAPAGYYTSDASASVSSMTPVLSNESVGSLWNSVNATTTMQYVNLPVGYNSTARYVRIWASGGTEGTPIATKGTVSNHSISITPSVTNTSGYITGSTINGTAITVSASELVSGTKSISANGTGIDVTNYASVDVAVEGTESDYTLVNIIPSQTVNCNTTINSYATRSAYFTNTPLLEDSKQYLVTFDNVQYVCECGIPETGWICIGDPRIEVSNQTITPFCICHETNGNTYFIEVNTANSGNHTLKVDEIHFLGTGTILQTKTITANGTYAASSDNADGYSSVTVNIPTMTLPTSAAASATSGYTSKATISPSTSDQYINIPTGYNSAGAYYKINAVANGSTTGPSSLSGSSATVSTGTNTITLTKTGVTTTPTVSAGYISSATASTATVTLTASVTTKAATTYHPSTSDQTISSGTYTTGTQTIKAVTVSGLAANKVLSGTTVKIGDSTDDDCVTSVVGSVTFQTIYSGSSAPSSSTGVNGDIYIQT